MEIAGSLRREACRRLEENRLRIHACVDRLTDDQLWNRPNAHLVSVGNLVLHLAGNVGQWISSTLGGAPDLRVRDREFDEKGPLDRKELMALLDQTLDQAAALIGALRPEDLQRTWRVQGFAETGTAIVLHVVEHFSYHTGQITLHTKLTLDIDTGYYSGLDLNTKG